MSSINNTRIKLKRRRSSMINESFSNSPGYSPRVQKLAEKHKREKDNVFKMFKTKRAIIVDNQRRNIHDVDIDDDGQDAQPSIKSDQTENFEVKVECEMNTTVEEVKQEPLTLKEESENKSNLKSEESSKNSSVFSKTFTSRLTSLKNTVKNMLSTASNTRSNASALRSKSTLENKENKANNLAAPVVKSSLLPTSIQNNAVKRANSVCNPKSQQMPKRAMASSKTSSSSLMHFSASGMKHSTSSLSTSACSNMSRMNSFSSSSNLAAKPAFKVSQTVKYDDKHLYSNVGHFKI
jgi:hypothetical protein